MASLLNPKVFKHLVYINNMIWVDLSKHFSCFFDDDLLDLIFFFFTLFFKILILKILLKLVAISDHYLLNLVLDFFKLTFFIEQNELVSFTTLLNPFIEVLFIFSLDLVSLNLFLFCKFHLIDLTLTLKFLLFNHKFGDLRIDI